MTIHKSKGLEFPVVILADTSTNYIESDLSKEVIMHQTLGMGINVVNEEYGITYPSVIKQAIRKTGLKETRSEELRMLYVALTRAKEKLIIFTTLDGYENFSNKQFVLYNGIKIDPCIIEKNKSYFQNINMALKKYKEDEEKKESLFNINVIKLEITDDFSEMVSDSSKNNKFNLKNSIESLNKIAVLDSNLMEENIKKNLDFTYEHLGDVEKQSRISVSALKQDFMKSIEQNTVEQEKMFEENKEEQNIEKTK